MGFRCFRETAEQLQNADGELLGLGPELFRLLGIGHEPVVP
jgi:hypothetical protein